MGVSGVAGNHVSHREGANPREHDLFPLAVNQVSTDKMPTVRAIAVAGAIVDAKPVQGIGGGGVVSVDQERTVGAG